ncbi:uncharacterized protein ATNIH1004_011491 [Aspergillus tanneri]|uniref:FAD-binding PCMH-type domain-containing protein n=1 Tax=Aspergillus tanneri TaxID=1220188 RepID=A0A5M9MA55_9EURO|nr:uncharacterized protein ATNIH1004_011491 [Aspergillus tanneri]KAA8642546.1 hypothetical protein ATNIH1004_011491 [Aspergillus tanneri]
MPFLSHGRVLELKEQLEGTRAEVISYGSRDYVQSIQRWSETCEKEAGAIVRVTSTSEVSTVINFSRKHHINFVVESGGHSTTGSSASHGGIVISMTTMRKVLTDPASKTVCVQGGATWEDVNNSTTAFGLAVVGATASQTGYGLTIDQLISVKMVLANGTIVEASETSNQDLFWAVRGAGQAFGVATEFVFRAQSIPSTLFGGIMFFTVDKLPKIVEFANQFDKKQEPRSGFFFGFRAHPLVQHTAIVAILFYNGTRSQAEHFFAPLLSLDAVLNETDMMSYAHLCSLGNMETVPAGRKTQSGTTVAFPLEAENVREIWTTFDNIIKSYPEMRDSTLAFELLPYANLRQVALDQTACANRGPYYNVGLLLCWRNHELDVKMPALKREILAHFKREEGDSDESHAEVYANYAGHETRPNQLFGDNLPRLLKMKEKYDPHNVFRKWHNLHNPLSRPP